MIYYIKENRVCVYITRDVQEVNKWLRENKKTIKSLNMNVITNDVTVEVISSETKNKHDRSKIR